MAATSQETLVSVVLPTYNRAASLPRAIHSVLNQTHAALELIVIDDGSTDSTAAVISQFGDERLHYHRCGENLGPSAARNLGVDRARGTWVAFQDSDDEWLPHKIERQLEVAADEADADLVFCSMVRVDPDAGTAKLFPGAPVPGGAEDLRSRLLHHNFIWTQTWLVRRDILGGAMRFDQSIHRGEDWDLALRIAREHRVVHVPELLVVAHSTPGSLLTDTRLEAVCLRRMLDSHAELFGRHPRAHARFCRKLASLSAQFGESAEMRAWAGRALRLAPDDPRNLLVWLLCLAGRKGFLGARAFKHRLRRGQLAAG